jgi:hypothetical protein
VLHCAHAIGWSPLIATRIKSTSDLHTDDLYAWSRAQADLLRAGHFAELDLAHLIEEIEDVGGAMKRAVRKRIRTIIEHLLKLEHSPASDPRAGWRATVRTQRVRLRDTLTPTVRREVEGSWPSFTRTRVALPKARFATMARTPPPTPCPPPAPTPSTS